MSRNYPVATHELPPVETVKKGFFRTEQVRDMSRIPRSDVNQQRVYRVGADFVRDDGDPQTLLEATQVALVDVSRDVVVPVVLSIPARDSGSFEVRVTFVCTVDDPVRVVRAGLTDLGGALEGYLRRHPRVFELGLDFDLEEINPARRRITAQVTAYTIASPPVCPGVRVELASVEIPTPEQVETVKETLRKGRGRTTIEISQKQGEHSVAALSQRNDFELDRNLRDHQRGIYERHGDVGNDALSALQAARAAGELTAREFAEIVERREAEAVAADREERERLYSREEAARTNRWESERVDQEQRWRLRHKNTELSATERLQRTDRQFEVFGKLTDRGAFDQLETEKLLGRALTTDGDSVSQVSTERRVVWTTAEQSGRDESGDLDDQVVREEDDD